MGQQRSDLIDLLTTLNPNRLTKQMNCRLALVAEFFLISLLKRLGDDMFDVRVHESPKLMECVPKRPGHAVYCIPEIRAHMAQQIT